MLLPLLMFFGASPPYDAEKNQSPSLHYCGCCCFYNLFSVRRFLEKYTRFFPCMTVLVMDGLSLMERRHAHVYVALHKKTGELSTNMIELDQNFASCVY